MFRAVSMKVSPLERLDELAVKSWVSAESRLAARLKLVRVRVEFSKNRLKTIRPCRAGTFLRLRVEISANESAVSRIPTISSRVRSSRPRRCLRVQGWVVSAVGRVSVAMSFGPIGGRRSVGLGDDADDLVNPVERG